MAQHLCRAVALPVSMEDCRLLAELVEVLPEVLLELPLEAVDLFVVVDPFEAVLELFAVLFLWRPVWALLDSALHLSFLLASLCLQPSSRRIGLPFAVLAPMENNRHSRLSCNRLVRLVSYSLPKQIWLPNLF